MSIWATLIPVIGVEDLDRTTRFYTLGLGFVLVKSAEASDAGPAYAHFRHGGVDLIAYLLEPAASGMQDRVTRKKLQLYVAVSDVDVVSAELRIRRIRVTPVVIAGHARYCEVEDPDGYSLRFGSVSDPVPGIQLVTSGSAV